MGLNIGYLTCGTGKESDECYTPKYAVRPCVKYLKQRGFKVIWCPFDSEHSSYVKVLRSEGFEVVYSHIEDGKDFFLYEPAEYDCIVSNPPFSLKDEVLERLYTLDQPFMILLPQNALQSEDRTNLFIQHGLEYLGFDKRIGFYTCGDLTNTKEGNHFASGYFCREVLPEKLIFEHLIKEKGSYHE